MYGNPACHVSTSMISLTRNSVFLQSNVKSSLIYSDLLPHFFPNPFSCICSNPGTPVSHPSHLLPSPPLPQGSDFCHSQISWLKRCVFPVLPSRMGTVLFSSALLSLTLYHCGLRDPEVLCDSTACSVLSLGEHWAVHQFHSAPLQQTSSSVNIFSWSVNTVWETGAIFQKGPYLQNKKTKILVHAAQQARRGCAALYMFMDSSSSQLCHLNLELTWPLPDFLLGNHLWKGFIFSFIVPVKHGHEEWKKNFSLMWLFFIIVQFWPCMTPVIFLEQHLTTLHIPHQSKPKLFNWTISAWALNPVSSS